MPKSHLDTILLAAQRAPTDATAQLYSFVRLSNRKLRTRIAALAANPHMATASESFLVCADLYRLERLLRAHRYKPGKFPSLAVHFAIGDAALAGQNMLIAAEMLGYRGCWIGGVANNFESISALTGLPQGVFPFAALTIGVPDEPSRRRPRLPRRQVFHENRYRKYSAGELKRSAKNMNSIASWGTWLQLLANYFAEGGQMERREKAAKRFLTQKLR